MFNEQNDIHWSLYMKTTGRTKNTHFQVSCIIKNVSSSTSHKKKSVFTSFRLYIFPSLRLSVFTSVREFMKITEGTSCTNTLKWFSPLCNLELHASLSLLFLPPFLYLSFYLSLSFSLSCLYHSLWRI